MQRGKALTYKIKFDVDTNFWQKFSKFLIWNLSWFAITKSAEKE